MKGKPCINQDMGLFVWQSANVIYVAGQKAVSFSGTEGTEVVWTKTSELISQDGRLVVTSWWSCVCVYSGESDWGGKCVYVSSWILVLWRSCAADQLIQMGKIECDHV